MNRWIAKSIALANEADYLDRLYAIYPMSVNSQRTLNPADQAAITACFQKRDDLGLLQTLLRQEVFPLKDSYVAYFKRNKTAIQRNPRTVARLTRLLYEMGLEEIFARITAPKETNRQMGPAFKRWLDQGSLGCAITKNPAVFLQASQNIILNTSDQIMKEFAHAHLGYDRNKGLDFIGKFHQNIIIAEAKFITYFGGHQNAQYADAIATMRAPLRPTAHHVKQIAILDGVLYIKGQHKMYQELTTKFTDDDVILSAVLLSEYLNQQ